MVRYAEWCAVIAEFVADRLGLDAEDHAPQVIANASLGVSMAAYQHWIRHPAGSDLLAELDRGFRWLAAGFDVAALQVRPDQPDPASAAATEPSLITASRRAAPAPR
jgi:hypothetical protein